MNKTNRSILYGILIGDGSVYKVKDANCVLQFTHSEKQEDYANFKAVKVNSIFGGKKNYPNKYTSNTAYGEVTYVKYGKMNKYCNQMRKVAYPNGKKTYTRKLLDFLSPEGIAYWYMDDGGLSKKYTKNKEGVITSVSCEMRISTYCPLEEIECIIEYFKEVWGIQGKKRLSKKHGTYYLAFNTTESRKFELLLKKYMHSTMFYKLPSNWSTRAQSTQN